jgi:hypothetical protein
MSASVRFAAASAVAATLLAFAWPAQAADLYEPRIYDESYSDDGPRDFERYAETTNEFETYERGYRNHDHDNGCVPRHVIRERLRAEGWGEFRDLDPRGDVVVVRARRPSGRPFELTINECNGEIVDARPVDDGRYYAYGSRRYAY